MTKPLTGRTVFLIFAGCFAVIIAVNLTMAFSAIRTFPGLEVRNGYVASQKFEAARQAQRALGWTVDAVLADGQVTMTVVGPEGATVHPASATAILGRATSSGEDLTLEFRGRGDALVADAPVADGRWLLRLDILADDGTRFRYTLPLVADAGA